MNKISVTTSISLNDYIRLNYYIYYSRSMGIITSSISLIFIMLVGISALDGGINFSDVGFTIVICVIYLLAMPVVLYFNAQKNYRTNKMIQGDMLYEFDPERIYVEGASYKGEFKLNALHKIKPTKNWLLLFHSKRTANFVNIRDCKQSDYEQITVMLQNSALPYKVNMYKSIQEKLKVDRCV